MQNITIGRYGPAEGQLEQVERDADGNELSRTLVQSNAGWIEGVRDDGSTWIMFLDGDGSPYIYWARREPSGGVIGDGIPLT